MTGIKVVWHSGNVHDYIWLGMRLASQLRTGYPDRRFYRFILVFSEEIQE
jgi:hypothetical protein